MFKSNLKWKMRILPVVHSKCRKTMLKRGAGLTFTFLTLYPQKMLSLYFEFIRLFCSEANWFSKKQNFSLRFFLLMFGLRVMVKRDGRTGWIPSFFNDWQKATGNDKQSCVNWNCLTDNLTLGDSLVGCSFCSTFGDTGKSEDCSRGGGTSN